MRHLSQQRGDLGAFKFLVLLEVDVEIVQLRLRSQIQQVFAYALHHHRKQALVARVNAQVAHAHDTGHVERAVELRARGRTDFQMHGQAEVSGMRRDGLQHCVVGAPQAPLLTIGEVDAHAGEFMAVGEVEQVHRAEAAVREVHQVRVGMREEGHGIEPREKFAREGGVQPGKRAPLARLEIAAEKFGKAGLEDVHLVFRERRGAAAPSMHATLTAGARECHRMDPAGAVLYGITRAAPLRTSSLR